MAADMSTDVSPITHSALTPVEAGAERGPRAPAAYVFDDEVADHRGSRSH